MIGKTTYYHSRYGNIPIIVKSEKSFTELSGNADWVFDAGSNSWNVTIKRNIFGTALRAGQQYTFVGKSKLKPKPKYVEEYDQLDEGLTTTLYHQTSPGAARKIIASQRFCPGAGGLAGGGIYFATSKNHTAHKAHQTGATLQATVRLGRVKQIGKSGNRALKRPPAGYDSILVDRDNGQEYVVYDPSQVTDIEYC